MTVIIICFVGSDRYYGERNFTKSSKSDLNVVAAKTHRLESTLSFRRSAKSILPVLATETQIESLLIINCLPLKILFCSSWLPHLEL